MNDTPLGEALAGRFTAAALGFFRNRGISADILLSFGDAVRLMRIRNGKVTEIENTLPPLTSWDFAVRATPRAWEALWEHPFPKPGWHDILALAKRGEMRIEGKLELFMAHLQYIKDLLNSPRKEVKP